MQNNNNSQTPPNQSLPEHRLKELEERLRNAELQNTQLRTTVDFLKNPQAPQNPQPSAFKPEVEDAIKNLVEARLRPVETVYRQQIGYLADQLDQAKFDLHYGSEKYQPFHQKVDQLRKSEEAMGRYITREDALRMVYFEETGKKNVTPEAPQVEPKTEPKFDPFFGAYVDPQTGLPVPAPQAQSPEEGEPQAQPNYQPQAQPGYPQPAQAAQPQAQPQQPYQVQPGARPPVQTAHPHGNAYGQQFQLPGQGINNPATTAQSQFNPKAPMDLERLTENDLEAFEKNFGDIAL